MCTLSIFFATATIEFPKSNHLKFADALQSNMIIQQSRPFKVWGLTDNNAKITVAADWLNCTRGYCGSVKHVYRCAKKPQIVAVRYAFVNAPITNLLNRKGLPAKQFRTDKWKENWIQPMLDFVPIIVSDKM